MIGSTVHALLATVISLLVGLPGAYCLARYAIPYKSLLISLCTIASMMPTKLVASSIALWLHGSGSWAIILAYCMLNIPFVIAVCVGIFMYRDATLEELAYDVGATWYHAYRSVVLPTLWPSIISLAGLIFVLCFTNVSIPLILGTNPWHYTCDMMLYQCHAQGAYDQCAIYGALRIFVKACILYRCTLSGISVIPAITNTVSVRAIPLCNAAWWYGYWIMIVALLSAPWVTMTRSLGYWAFGSYQYTAAVYDALLHSMQGACIGGCIAVIIGYFVLVLSLERGKHFITMLTMIPFFLGSVGCSIACIMGVQCGIYSPLVAAALCYSIMHYPYVYRILSMHMPLYDARWHDIARSYGATRWDIQRYHILPFMRSGLMRSWYLVCILGFTEVGAGAVLAQGGWITMPVLMRQYVVQGQYEEAWALYGLSVGAVLLTWLALYLLVKVLDWLLKFLRYVMVHLIVFARRQRVDS
jgi:thiamine transport system permease protein